MSIIYSKEQDGTLNVAVSGYITNDAKVYEKVVLFSVCYNRKAKKYMDCKAWSDSIAGKIAACLEKHDEVTAFGTYEKYVGKDGKERDQIIIDGLIPMLVPQAEPETPHPQSGAQGDFAEIDDDDAELPF